jgi:hypothetical protein
MPSHLHESHVLLFRNQPTLAPELIRGALRGTVPSYREARVVSADLTNIQPAEYRADMVIELRDDGPVFGIIVEVQLSENKRKPFVWPAYVANLRARLECPVCLLVVTPDEATAKWAAKSLEIGGLHKFAPYVLGPSGVPEVVDEGEARANPELAVLSAMAHGCDANIERSAQIAVAAQRASAGLDADRSKLYFDLILKSLSEAARKALKTMDARTYEYQSDFARQYVAQGEAQGEARGRAALILRLLTLKFGVLSADTQKVVLGASIADLDAIGERLLSANGLSEAIGAELMK